MREKLIRTGAKFVRHGRYPTFRIAELATPRALFVHMLCRLRPRLSFWGSQVSDQVKHPFSRSR